MNLLYISFISIILCFVCRADGQTVCINQSRQDGEIYDSSLGRPMYKECWRIDVPQDKYVRLEIKHLTIPINQACTQNYLKISVSETSETYTYCSKDTSGWNPVTALSDVNITFSNYGYSYTTGSFKLKYHIEDLMCAQKNHFRCTNHTCIHNSQVCDGVKDCVNGIDEIGCEKGVLAVKGVNVSRESVIKWLKTQRSASFGWGKNTHRAITALFLSKAVSFQSGDLDEELMAKQLELQTSVALLRNSSEPLTVSELSMFVNALTATCHNPREFYGYDLLQILGERVTILKTPSPGAYLILCNSNWTISSSDVRNLLKLLQGPQEYPFHLDVQALTVMALSCFQEKTKEFRSVANATIIYNATIEKFITGQLSDGSFGNVYTTALVSQALIASGQENNKRWNVTSTVSYLMKELNSSSTDFLSAYLALPIFSGSSLVEIGSVNCANISRKHDEDHDISDVRNKLGGKMRVQYSLYVGDQKDVVHTIYLRMPDDSTAYDIMRVAQLADPKYKFLYRDASGYMYVYEIADITNDPEAGKFWLLYAKNNSTEGKIEHYTQSPDKFLLKDEDHLIMWYKTANI